MSIDSLAVERLIALGRRQGFVTTDQIDHELPVELLTEVEIAEIVERLERAGIPVELDEAVAVPRAGSDGLRLDAPTLLPDEPPRPPRDVSGSRHPVSPGPRADRNAATGSPTASPSMSSRILLLIAAALAAILVVGIPVMLLAD